MDGKEVLAFVEAVDGADFHAVRVFAADAVVGHDIRHDSLQKRLKPGGGKAVVTEEPVARSAGRRKEAAWDAGSGLSGG
jgi:hypothetical protein